MVRMEAGSYCNAVNQECRVPTSDKCSCFDFVSGAWSKKRHAHTGENPVKSHEDEGPEVPLL